MKSLIALLLTFFIFSNSYSQCNTNTSICTPGIAGPFSFISASANPSSCLDYYNSAASPNYAYIILYITTGGNLNLLINGDQTTGFLDVSIFDITNATDPCVELSLGTEIGCNYASAYDGCNEFGSTFPCSSEVPAPIVSAGDVIMILVEDWSNVMTSFTLELSNFPGSAQTGSPNPTINPVSPLCISDNPIQLSAVNPGGFWSGVGVSSTGVFNPLLAGPGIFTVNYSIGTAPCNASAYTIVTVLSPSADAGSTQIVCLGSTVTIGADPVCNSEGAIYSWNNGGSSGIINLSGANQDHGQTNVSPISTTTYELTISDGGCIATSQVTVSVDLPPTALNPISINLECIGDVPVPNISDVISVSDDYTSSPLVTFISDISNGNTCPEIITRTYSVTDDCGNFTDVQQLIIIGDVTPPVFLLPPASVTVQCSADVPSMTNLSYTDNCDASGTVSGTDGPLVGGTCGGTITRTWTVTDACGNNAIVIQTITVDDTIPPTASNPATTIVPGGPAPTVDITVVNDETDNCIVNPVVAFVSEVSDNNTCPETITRIYSVTDDCGNIINVAHLILITDFFLPTASNPIPLNVECIGDIPPADINVVIDESDNQGIPTVAFVSDVSDGLSCPETITRTYSVTDICGGQITVDQIITVMDITPPVLSYPPADILVQCLGDLPAMISLGYTDNCDSPGIAIGVDISDGQNCPETITRTWVYTDLCGNSSSAAIQTITVDDTTLPTASAPANINVGCMGDVPLPNILEVTNELDNCTANPIVAYQGDVSDGLSCPEIITRTYSITDECGNQITVNQIITVNDVTPPIASNPANISVPSSMDVPFPDPTVVITESDNCTLNPIVTWVNDISDGNVCNMEKITRTYSITDDCGNQTLVFQEITILATQPPIDAGPSQIICQGDLVTISEINPLGVPVVWSPFVPNGQFDPFITTTYTITADNLGCVSTDSLTITVDSLVSVSFIGDVLSGCEPLTVNFTNTSNAPGGLANCEWLINGQTVTGCGTIPYIFPNVGTYDIILNIISGSGCTASIIYQDYINVEGSPLASFTPSSSQLTTLDTDVNFINNSTGAVNYEWDFGNGEISIIENPFHEFSEGVEGAYTVELVAFSSMGCTDTAYATINIIEELIYYIPNSFTPDGDSHNQIFLPIFTSGYDPYDFSMLIFNRWGEIIWESHDDKIGWDGTYGGKIMNDGMYNWKIIFKLSSADEHRIITGSVNLIR
ncbi:MAG: gliding motility-associated C-terminal domain-containing protein [Crocinitomicaceae bacterium]